MNLDASTVIAALITLLFSGFFSGMEIAFVSSSKLRFEMDRDEQGLLIHSIAIPTVLSQRFWWGII